MFIRNSASNYTNQMRIEKQLGIKQDFFKVDDMITSGGRDMLKDNHPLHQTISIPPPRVQYNSLTSTGKLQDISQRRAHKPAVMTSQPMLEKKVTELGKFARDTRRTLIKMAWDEFQQGLEKEEMYFEEAPTNDMTIKNSIGDRHETD